MNYTKIVEERINKYLSPAGVTVQDILGDTDAFVFGGAVRDSIADVPINDIDIIGFNYSIADVIEYLEKKRFRILVNEKLDDLYKDIHLFKPPLTLERQGCKIQIIALNITHPLFKIKSIKPSTQEVGNAIYSAMDNVDIDICAVSYNPKKGVEELLPEVFFKIESKHFSVLEDKIMHNPDRINVRISKMISKGFTCVGSQKAVSDIEFRSMIKHKPQASERFNAWE